MKFLDDELQPAPYYTEKHKYIGEINIADGVVDITDPCYNSDAWCALFDYKIKPGIYKCYIDVINFPWKGICEENDIELRYLHNYKVGEIIQQNDNGIMVLEIIHKDEEQNNPLYKLKSTSIGVDAGLCGFYNHKSDYESDNKWNDFWQNLTQLKNGCTCDCRENGVTVSSGFGDGCYMLSEARNKNNEIIALKLNFDDEQDGEESYADEEE